MRKRIIISGVSLCLIAVLCLSAAIKAYRAPRPILDDIINCQIVVIRYNDAFEQGNYIETEITEFDEQAVLKCISKYNEQKTFQKYMGGPLADFEIEIYVHVWDKGLKKIYLGKEDFSCDNSIKNKIINSQDLKEELKTLILKENLSN